MSLPELGYAAEGGGGSSARPAGELLLRGPQLFTGACEATVHRHGCCCNQKEAFWLYHR